MAQILPFFHYLKICIHNLHLQHLNEERRDELREYFLFSVCGTAKVSQKFPACISKFTINNLHFFSQVFQGNTNPTDVAKTRLLKPTLTRFIRIRPVTWETGIALRFEVYGCKISGGNYWDVNMSFFWYRSFMLQKN